MYHYHPMDFWPILVAWFWVSEVVYMYSRSSFRGVRICSLLWFRNIDNLRSFYKLKTLLKIAHM